MNANLSSNTTIEERFKALLEVTSDVAYSLSPDGSLMYELDEGGFLKDSSKPILEWKIKNVFTEDMEMVNEKIADAIAAKSIFELEYRVNCADDMVGWTFFRAVPILDGNGEIKEWFGLASDITKRKLAENALAEAKDVLGQQKRTYEMIISGSPDLMYMFDLDYKFTYANRALLEMWGKTWEDAIGKGLIENGYEAWHAEMHEREIDLIRDTGKSVRGEVAFPHASLGRRLYDYILNPVFNNKGEVIAVSGTTRDVTDRDQWEQKLKESAEHLQAMNEDFAVLNEELSASNEHIIATNNHLSQANANLIAAQQTIEEGKMALRLAIEAANFGTWYINTGTREFITDTRLKELFGYYPDEPLSIEAALARITDDYRECISSQLENAIHNNGDYDVSYPVIGLHDQKLRWLRAIGNLVADPSGSFSAFTGIVMDITEQKMEEMRKNDFMGMVSHELKTPLTSLTAYLQLMNMREAYNPDVVSRRAVSQSLRQAKRMTDMINGFLDFSRLESAKISIISSSFDIAILIREAQEEAQMLYTTHKFIFEPVDSQIIHADKGKIAQVIANLIGNAVKYSPIGSSIQVACITTGGEVEVSVKDQGIGIEKSEIPKIFDRFYRVEGNHLISGFGIGLYISSEIIKLHGGRIWVGSDLGEGSVFYFTVPVS
ncbi:ATP-binding protein [Pedobacter agri]|uniref:PAS domain-containing sensor histidine kinase n=1 Tax=Pedobacter agri TaxID=454586 RepID=UPI00292E2E2E|nr:ATP-binding protein [Pedobacter agri]